MEYTFTRKEIEELEQIGNLYRKTIYNKSLISLPDIVQAFGDSLKEMDGDISQSIVGEVFRYHKLISSNYFSEMRNRIDGLNKAMNEELPRAILYSIVCRLKSWESVLRKILKRHFEGKSIILPDLIALRIIIDSTWQEKQQEEACQRISNICIKYFMKEMCTLMAPSNSVESNTLIKNYIKHPKNNGYKSIHLAFMDIQNNIFEVQIRTLQMDADAEFGAEKAENIEPMQVQYALTHTGYKYEEYKELIPYISFNPQKVSRPYFRIYKNRLNPYTLKIEDKLVDKIGLVHAKPIEFCDRIF